MVATCRRRGGRQEIIASFSALLALGSIIHILLLKRLSVWQGNQFENKLGTQNGLPEGIFPVGSTLVGTTAAHGKEFSGVSNGIDGQYIPVTVEEMQSPKQRSDQRDDISKQEHEHGRSGKSSFIRRGELWIHVGPPKTGTTTLQNELNSIPNELQHDGYHFTKGMFHRSHGQQKDIFFLDPKCQRSLAKARFKFLNETNKSNKTLDFPTDPIPHAGGNKTVSLYEELVNIPCWKDRLDQLRYWREVEGKRNLIISSEGIGFRWFTIPGYQEGRKLPADWISVKLTLEPYYNIHIVVGYRRYFEWLVSAKYHEDKYNPSKPLRKRWPKPKLLKGNNKIRSSALSSSKWGQELFPVYPTLIRPETQRKFLPFHYTDTILHMLKPYFQKSHIHILNIHGHQGNQSILTMFLCHILDAPYACHRSKGKDQMQQQQYKANVRKDSALEESLYDMIVTNAVTRWGYYSDAIVKNDQKLTRQQVVLQAKQYHQIQLRQKRLDLPMKCPTDKEQDLLLHQSLALEEEILHFTQTVSSPPSTSFEMSTVPYNSSQTINAFHDFMQKKMMCTVNIEKCFQNGSVWHEFFAKILR